MSLSNTTLRSTLCPASVSSRMTPLTCSRVNPMFAKSSTTLSTLTLTLCVAAAPGGGGRGGWWCGCCGGGGGGAYPGPGPGAPLP